MKMKDIVSLGSITRSKKQLLTLKALYQKKKLNPSIDTKDEYKSKTLAIKF